MGEGERKSRLFVGACVALVTVATFVVVGGLWFAVRESGLWVPPAFLIFMAAGGAGAWVGKRVTTA